MAAKSLKLPPDFDRLTPGARVNALARPRADPAQVLDMLALGADLNILRPVKKSIPSVRSGINSYIKFRDLINRPALPPTADTVQLWSATVNPGKTFNQYLAHPQKATPLLNQSLDWLAPTIRSIGKWLENAREISFKFQNYIRSAELLQILEWAKLDTPQGQAYFLSYLFSLMAHRRPLRPKGHSPMAGLRNSFPKPIRR